MVDEKDRPLDGELDAFDLEQSIHGQSTDAFLQRLVHLVNTTTIELDVTLTLGGNVITGRLIGGKRYHQEFASVIADAWPTEDSRQGIRDAFSSWAELYEKPEELAQRPPQYIHLRDAYYVTQDAQFPRVGMLWRGRINAVSGFALGRFSFME